MPSPVESLRIVIAGASSLLGAELRSLLEESRIAAADVSLVDEELAAGTLTEAAGEAAVIQPVDEESFHGAHLVLFAGSAGFTRANLAAAHRSGASVIDLSGGALDEPGVQLWEPGKEMPPQKSTTYAVLSAPGAAAAALLDALSAFGLRQLGLIFFRPVSEAGRAGIEELESQTSQLLSFQNVGQSVFATQVAFSLLNRYGQASGESLSQVRQRILREVSLLAGNCRVQPAIEVVHAPVFYGYTFAALAETTEISNPETFAAACQKAGFVLWSEEEVPLGNLTAAGDNALHLALPGGGRPQSGAWWCWGAADNIKLPASTAVKLAEKLV